MAHARGPEKSLDLDRGLDRRLGRPIHKAQALAGRSHAIPGTPGMLDGNLQQPPYTIREKHAIPPQVSFPGCMCVSLSRCYVEALQASILLTILHRVRQQTRQAGVVYSYETDHTRRPMDTIWISRALSPATGRVLVPLHM